MTELESLKQDLIKYRQLIIHLEDSIYDLQICLNKMVSTLEDALDQDTTKSGAV